MFETNPVNSNILVRTSFVSGVALSRQSLQISAAFREACERMGQPLTSVSSSGSSGWHTAGRGMFIDTARGKAVR